MIIHNVEVYNTNNDELMAPIVAQITCDCGFDGYAEGESISGRITVFCDCCGSTQEYSHTVAKSKQIRDGLEHER